MLLSVFPFGLLAVLLSCCWCVDDAARTDTVESDYLFVAQLQ